MTHLAAAELQTFRDAQQARRPTSKVQAALRAGAWIYGAGGYGLRVLKALERHGFECVGFIDKRASDPAFVASLPRPAVSPEAFDDDLAKGRTLIVGVMNTGDSIANPQNWARSRPFEDILTPMHLPEALGSELDNYWMTTRAFAAAHIADIAEAASWLADEASVATMEGLARFRLAGEIDFHPTVDIERQYLPPDVPIRRDDMTLVDGGAFVGDTFLTLTKLGARIRQWYAFEPDLENYRKLCDVAKTAGVSASLFPCALGDAVAEFELSTGEGAASHLGAGRGAASIVRTLPIDAAIPGATPSYIKLDIEGFEARALLGMRETIARSRPALAVSIYHKPDDLWTLPRLVRQLLPDAKLYVRQHGHNGFDTVLYAVP